MKLIFLLLFFVSINIFPQDLLLTSIKSSDKILTGYIIIDGKECPIYKTIEPKYLGDNCNFYSKNKYTLFIEIKKDSILEEIFEKEILIDSIPIKTNEEEKVLKIPKFLFEEYEFNIPEKYTYYEVLYRIKIKQEDNIYYSNFKFCMNDYNRLVISNSGISIYPSIKEKLLNFFK